MDVSSSADAVRSRWIIWSLTAIVFVGVAAVMFGRPPSIERSVPTSLATLNACLNGMATICLCVGFWCIRQKRIAAHRACMLAAFLISCMFLVTYLLHHAQVGSVRYQGVGWVRAIYFGLLIPHVVLAGPVVPLALFTLYRGWTQRIAAHRAIARITLPIWLFVSASGVVIYFMLY
ncbi:MAG: DUF420 domain-containing protein [Polyangiaceae bacterium]|nr:DUF420 domain-containing protein [Polyangiaceae bacterium]